MEDYTDAETIVTTTKRKSNGKVQKHTMDMIIEEWLKITERTLIRITKEKKRTEILQNEEQGETEPHNEETRIINRKPETIIRCSQTPGTSGLGRWQKKQNKEKGNFIGIMQENEKVKTNQENMEKKLKDTQKGTRTEAKRTEEEVEIDFAMSFIWTDINWEEETRKKENLEVDEKVDQRKRSKKDKKNNNKGKILTEKQTHRIYFK